MKNVNIIAGVLLVTMFVLMLASAWNDSATMDELAHIPAGFGYVTQLDYRLNPEHPPLVKVLSALSAYIFVRPHFPTDTPYWRNDVNGQWAQGATFLYESGNDADRVIFWSRLPLILLAIGFGSFIFWWTKSRFGNAVGILTLILFAFSPTVLAHSRYVTTDLGAALGFFIGIAAFISSLERPGWRAVLLAGLALGAALLLKFSAVLLVPLFIILLVSWVAAKPYLHLRERSLLGMRLAGKTALIGLISLIIVWIAYGAFTWNYPPGRQMRDAEFLLSSYGFRPAAELDAALIRNTPTRPLGQYLLGFLMVQQRSAGGNTAFFLGEVSAAGSRLYFPLLYLLKEPLALHILTLAALAAGLTKIRRTKLSLVRRWIADHFPEFSAMVFIAFYWIVSIKSPLNIGVRHVLPTFPFVYVLVSRQLVDWLQAHEISDPRNRMEWLKGIYEVYIKTAPRYIIAVLLLLWLVADTILAFPHFMAYYNELVGGARNGWRIAVDSNYDWGQDLKRLARFVEKNNIQKISVDYFGGGNPRYYLGDRFEPWQSSRGPAHGWFAISATFREGAFGAPAPGFIRKPEDSYEWLKPYQPVEQIGYSIFVYKLP